MVLDKEQYIQYLQQEKHVFRWNVTPDDMLDL